MKRIIQYISILSVALVMACSKGHDKRPDDYYVNHYKQFAKAFEDSSLVGLATRTNLFCAEAAAGNDTIEKAVALLESGDIQNYYYDNPTEAIKFYKNSIAYFESKRPAVESLLIKAYVSCMIAMEHKGDFDEEQRLMEKCAKVISQLKDSGEIVRHSYSILFIEAGMYVAQEKWDDLERCIATIENFPQAHGKPVGQDRTLYILGHKIQLALGRKDYATALKYSNEQRALIDRGESMSRRDAHDVEHARILRGLGHGNEAYDLYASAMKRRETAIHDVNTKTLNEMQKEMTISLMQRQMESQRMQAKIFIALFIIVVVAILFYVVNLRKLNRKNIALIRQAKETEQAERLSAETLRQVPRERLDNDQQLYSRLLDLMEGDKRPYTAPECNRETLAQLCATNGKYIDRVISRFADGKTTNEYITHYRLRRAMKLLTGTDETVDAIAELCGFSSTRTFYRRFRDKVGMSPTEYRNLQTRSEGSL
ncbi:MAG: helix-turn-helix domain-containing protein [Prevotella sp.]